MSIRKVACIIFKVGEGFLDQHSHSSMSVVSGYCLRKMLVDRIIYVSSLEHFEMVIQFTL